MNVRMLFLLPVLFASVKWTSGYSQPSEKPFQRVPNRQDAIIYQVNIRAFSETGDLKGVMPRLDSIKALGANVVYLMPTYPVGKVKSVNSPYCIRDYVSVNEEFGSLQDLRDLVNAAHGKGLAVILDWVANHTAYDHPWTANPSWYLQDSTGRILSPPGMGWNDVAQLNFKNADMRLEMISAMKYWVNAANIDGFRCDYADGPPVDFWKQAIDTLRNLKDRKLLMLAEGSRAAHFSAGFDYNFGFRFFERMKDIHEHKRSVVSIDSLNISDYKGVVDGTQSMVRYVTNHDVNGSDGTPQELFGGQRGAMAAFVVAAYMKGIPMIYNGEEVGTPYRLVFPFTGRNIDWSLNPQVTAEYKKILAARNSIKALRAGQLTSFSNADVCAFTKKEGKETVLVIVNLRAEEMSYALPSVVARSSWKDIFTGGKAKLPAKIKLAPYSYRVLVTQTSK
ncbi:alpha-amylase family glycosyl hydrolase [Terrimonas sp. NA20]|uniref:Alpha-amylase family glycosyl hydrolase n=1 Tax=Terrimonas ginsenosidimutans TaxID=2908004 RepID=A0ABS9KRW3_9BACT|nr:alpha-amylase family glycosyl hydrolase [Terrimonas ginsenosidimutans]MCG2615064.1 alpha-amylase family glycosyl hydrolase [Terrimonas ginsenosidimutans]